MDENNHRRRQNDQPYAGPDLRFNSGQSQSRGYSSSSSDRYRTGPLTTPPSTSRASGAATAAAYSSYYPEPQPSFPTALPTNPLQYPAAYPQDQRQQQGFTTYNPDLIYNAAQQTPQTNVYDSSQQFQPRQPAAMHMLSDVAAPYFPNEPTTTPGPPVLQHHASSGSSTVYQQHQQSPVDRSTPIIQPGYTGTMAMGGIPQAAADVLEDEDFQAQGPGMEAAYTAYQTALKGIFQDIIAGRLAVAGPALLEVSEWLLGHVGDLGLTVDEVSLHSDRIRLWGEFNTAWLSIFQKQKDMLESRQQIHPPQSLMTQEFINKMAKDLIRMCDAIEKHGLVDYQYGVAEEQTISILTECLDLQESIEGVNDGSSLAQNPGVGRVPP